MEADGTKKEIQMVSDADRKVVEKVLTAFRAAETNQATLMTKWERMYRYYVGSLEEKKFRWQSNLNIPTAYGLVESQVPRMMAFLYDQEGDYNQLRPVSKSLIKSAKAMQELIHAHRLSMGYFDILQEYLKDGAIYGTGIIKESWKSEQDFIYENKIMEQNGKKYYITEKTKKKKTIFNQPVYDVIEPFFFFPDPMAVTSEEMGWCIHRSYIRKDVLKELAANPKNKYKNIGEIQTGYKTMEKIPIFKQGISGYSLPVAEGDFVEILEYWEKGGRTISIANREVVIRDIDKLLWTNNLPFVIYRDTIIPHQFWGEGVISPLEGLINERNSHRNLKMENLNTVVNRILFLNKYADVDFEEFELQNRPGGTILTDDITNTARPLEITDASRSFDMSEDIIQRDIQDASGIWDYMRGATPERRETATAIVRLQRAAQVRINIKILNAIFAINKITKLHIELCKQFLREEVSVPIPSVEKNGEEIIKLNPSDFQMDFNIQPLTGVSEMNIEAKREALMQLLMMPLFQSPNIKTKPFQKFILNLLNIREAEDIIPEEEETPMPEQSLPPPKGIPSAKGVPGTPMPPPEEEAGAELEG